MGTESPGEVEHKRVSSPSIPACPWQSSAAPAVLFQGDTELMSLNPHGTPQAALSGGDFGDSAEWNGAGGQRTHRPQTSRFSPPAPIPLTLQSEVAPGHFTC